MADTPGGQQERGQEEAGQAAAAQGSAGLALCRLSDLACGQARGFEAAGVFAVGTQHGPVIYRNACPHLGVPLDWAPDRFLSADGSVIMCGTHGAEFRIADGYCLRGPCREKSLDPVAHHVADGWIIIGAATST